MVKARDPTHCKRRRSEEPYLDRALQPSLKRQKLDHTVCNTTHQPSTTFWDSLSRIWLTKRALRELDRRTSQVPSERKSNKRLTRSKYAEWYSSSHLASNPLPNKLSAKVRKEIRVFARHGGPDIVDLRGYSEPVDPLNLAMSSSQSSSKTRKRSAKSSSKTVSSKKSSAYDRDFEQNLVDHGIYGEGYEYPDGRESPTPKNWEEINSRLIQPRQSLSPSKFSEENFKHFKRANAHAFTEEDVKASVIPTISGISKSDKTIAREIIFANLDPLTDGGLVPGKPDFYYGSRPEELDRRTRTELAGHIIPSTQKDVPILPNFFLEAKGPDGSAAVVKRQACYNGALGARAIHSLQSHSEDQSIYDNKAYTITSTYHDGQLRMYTTHLTESRNRNRPSDSHTTQLRSFAMTDSRDSFRQGATAYRNGREWAKEQRQWLIEEANDRACARSNNSASFRTQSSSQATVSAVAALSPESDTSADELAFEEGTGRDFSIKRARNISPRSSRNSSRQSQTLQKKKPDSACGRC